MGRVKGVFLAVFIWALPALAFPQGVQWVPYERALEEANRTGKPLFLYFFVKDCSYCRKMDSETLVSGRVVEYLREGFISVRIDADKQPQLARRYMVRGFPTSWFLTSEGRPISSLPGYVGPEEFARVLRYVVGGHYRSKSLREYLSGS